MRKKSSEEMKELGEFIKLYSSVCQNVTDEETRQEVKEIFYLRSSAPLSESISRLKAIKERQRHNNPKAPSKIARLKQRLQDDFSIWYYNLDTSDPEQIDEFLKHCEDKRAMGLDIMGEEIEAIKEVFRDFIRDDQPIYKRIVDKIISGEELSKTELDHIQSGAFGFLRQLRLLDDGLRIFRDYAIYRLHEVYEWVIDLPFRKLELGRCQASDCRRLFIPDPKNISRQVYCSSTCRSRIGKRRERKRKMAASMAK